MQIEDEDYFLNPPLGSAAERAVEFGIDLTLTLENLRLTREERIQKLDNHLQDLAELKANARLSVPTSLVADGVRAPVGAIGRQLKWLAEASIDCVIVDDLAGALQGSSTLPQVLAVCYLRDPVNLSRLVNALALVHARVRGTAADSPIHWNEKALDGGRDSKLLTDLGAIDLLGGVKGVGAYEDALEDACWLTLSGYRFPVLDIGKLIVAKRTTGRAKDLIALAELEAMLRAKRDSDQH